MSKFYYDHLAGAIKLNSDGSTVEIVTSYSSSGVYDPDLRKKNAQERIISLETAEIYCKRESENSFCHGPFFWGMAKQEAEALLNSRN